MGYLYLKKSELPRSESASARPRRQKIAASLFMSLGALLFLSVLYPILHFQFGYSTKFDQVLNPLSAQSYSQNDYTQLSSWFVNGSNPQPLPQDNLTATRYTLSIPKLKVKDALVIYGSTDLKASLIHYPQTALPGALGSPVIFGHSVLPQFFNPKSYITIFSTLYKLKPGDEIFVNYDHVNYKYLVSEMFEVQPTDLSVLEQRFDSRYLTLITCSPPGTYLRRLVVRAQITDNI